MVRQHHIPRLEVAIEEGILLLSRQVLSQETEIGFELQFVEVNLRSLQEAVFEVVQVEEHRVDVKLRLRVAVGEIEFAGPPNLHIRQLADGAFQQFLLSQSVTASSLASSTDSIEE